MGLQARGDDWIRRMDALTIEPVGDGPHDSVGSARLRVARLVGLACALHWGQGACTDCSGSSACRLGPVAGAAEACRLAGELATAPGAAVHADPGRDVPGRFVRALREAAGAVYLCRRVAHPTGTCWFSAQGPDHDTCGRVLALSHRLRIRTRAC